MILLVIIILIIISVLLSLWSLRNVLKMHEVDSAKDTLSKSKILFQDDIYAGKSLPKEKQVF